MGTDEYLKRMKFLENENEKLLKENVILRKIIKKVSEEIKEIKDSE